MNVKKFLSSESKIREICEKHDLSFLGLFGSYATGDENEDSDVDILYEFKDGVKKSLLDIVHVKQNIEDIIHKPVDIVSRANIKPFLKQFILPETKTLYEEVK